MGKRFKLLLCNLFHSCRSKEHLPSQPLRRQDANWHVLDGRDTFVPPPLISVAGPAAMVKQGQRGRRTRRKRASTSTSTLFRPRLSTSSTDNCLFSEEETDMGMGTGMEIERETLVSHSSKSFYTDSSTDFSPHLETIREGPALQVTRRKKRAKPHKRSVLHKTTSPEDAGEDGDGAPARLSAVFQRLVPCAAVEVELGNHKVRESYAVVKRSDDPYDDFRRSMAEMIVEKEMASEADLKELLRCFLSLNSEHHHGIILTAFNDIWDAFFSNSNSNST